MAEPIARWESLPEWTDPIPHDAQVMVVAGTGGGKSTLAATMTLDVGSLVAIDGKARLTLPDARIVDLPVFDVDAEPGTLKGEPGGRAFATALREGLAWQDPRRHGKLANRVILRPDVRDTEGFEAHDAMFRALYLRGSALVWIDEITGTGATANRTQTWLRAISARGRTRGVGLWTLSQRPYGLTPTILRSNAEFTIIGSADPDDVKDLRRPGAEIATTIPRKSGRFLLWQSGKREPFRLYVPIPPGMRKWAAP